MLYLKPQSPIKNKENYIYPLTTYDQVILADGSRWTGSISEDEKAAIIREVVNALATPVYGRVDENNNIILSGTLADGTYTIKYEDAEGNVTEIGTLTSVTEPAYTNLFVADTAMLNTRMSGGSSSSKAADGYVMSANIILPEEITITGATAGDAYITVPASMWTGSANIFLLKNDAISSLQGYMDYSNSPGTVSGDWVKIPLRDQWGTTFTASGVIVSLYVSASAITTSDIADIQIYYNECPV